MRVFLTFEYLTSEQYDKVRDYLQDRCPNNREIINYELGCLDSARGDKDAERFTTKRNVVVEFHARKSEKEQSELIKGLVELILGNTS